MVSLKEASKWYWIYWERHLACINLKTRLIQVSIWIELLWLYHPTGSSWPSSVIFFYRHISTGFTSLNVTFTVENITIDRRTFLSAEHLANAARNSFGSGLPIVLWIGSGLDVSDGMNFDLSNPGSSEIKLDVFEFVDNDDCERVFCIFISTGGKKVISSDKIRQ